jgi:hypothetical protein
VVSRLQKINAPFAYSIHQSMFLSDPARPTATHYVFQRLRLADACKWLAEDGLDEFKNAESNLSIRVSPIAQILAKPRMKYRFPINVAGQVPSPGAVSPEVPACPCERLRAAML